MVIKDILSYCQLTCYEAEERRYHHSHVGGENPQQVEENCVASHRKQVAMSPSCKNHFYKFTCPVGNALAQSHGSCFPLKLIAATSLLNSIDSGLQYLLGAFQSPISLRNRFYRLLSSAEISLP